MSSVHSCNYLNERIEVGT